MIPGYVLVLGKAYKDSSGNLLTGTLSFQPVLNTGAKTSFRAGQTVATPGAWSAAATYALGGVATGGDGQAYVSLVDANHGNAPVTMSNGAVTATDTAHWLLVPKGCFSSGQTSHQPVAVNVDNGSFAAILPDVSGTFPLNVGFALTETDGTSGACTLGPGYNCFQPTTVVGQNGSANSNGVVDFDAYNPSLAPQVTVQSVSFQIGSVTTGAPGAAASATNVGTATAAVLNLTIPQGTVGPAAVLNPNGTAIAKLALQSEDNQVLQLGTGTSLPNIRETSTLMILQNKTLTTGDHAICGNGQLTYDNSGGTSPGYGFLEDGTSIYGSGDHYNSLQCRPWIYATLANLGGITVDPYGKGGTVGRYIAFNAETGNLDMSKVGIAIGLQANIPAGANNFGVNLTGSARSFFGGDVTINNTDTTSFATGNTNLYLQNTKSAKAMAFILDADGNLNLNGATTVQFNTPVKFNSGFLNGQLTISNAAGNAILQMYNNAGGNFSVIIAGNSWNLNGSGGAYFNVPVSASQPVSFSAGLTLGGTTPSSGSDTSAGVPAPNGAMWADDNFLYRRCSDGLIKKIAWVVF